MAWPKRIPAKFLSRNEVRHKDVLPLRIVGSVEECLRCTKLKTIDSELEAKLTFFVCRECRNDVQEWDWMKRSNGISYSIQSMVYESPVEETSVIKRVGLQQSEVDK